MSSRAAKARLDVLFSRVLSRCASKFRRRFMACNAPRDFIPSRDVFQATRVWHCSNAEAWGRPAPGRAGRWRKLHLHRIAPHPARRVRAVISQRNLRLKARFCLASPAFDDSASGKFHWQLQAGPEIRTVQRFVAHRDDTCGVTALRGANKSSGSLRGKKCFFTKSSMIDRFNWYPDRHRPVMEFSSFVVCSPTSVDARRAASRSPNVDEVDRQSTPLIPIHPLHVRRHGVFQTTRFITGLRCRTC
jgi:hypothetical protein